MDIDEAEARVLEAVREAFRRFLDQARSTVFADPENPDWLVWPTGAWQVLVDEIVTPVIVEVFEAVLREFGVLSESVIDGAVATFAGQGTTTVTEATTIPDETYNTVFAEFVALGALAALALLVATSDRWGPMLGVMGRNGGALAVNAGTFESARLISDGGFRQVSKTWRSRDDEKTRLTHVLVDNTTVSVDDTFNVGGFPLRFPHDPLGPVQEVANCRCRLELGVSDG